MRQSLGSITATYKWETPVSETSPLTDLTWHGPFTLLPSAEWLLDAQEAELAGIYLFTVPTEKDYLPQYVGMTTRSFRARVVEHIQCLLSGAYWIHNADDLFSRYRIHYEYSSGGEFRDRDFLGKLLSLNRHAIEYLTRTRIFVGPLPRSTSPEVLRRIESALIEAFKTDSDCNGLVDQRVSHSAILGCRMRFQSPRAIRGLRATIDL